jgi:hypothetical protein
MNKIKDEVNFHDILSLNDSEVILKDLKIDIKVIKTSYRIYASFILLAQDYEILSKNVEIESPPHYIDSISFFKNYLDSIDILDSFTNDFLLFSKIELNYKTDIGKTNEKVATYSIKKQKYINIDLD